MVSGILGQSCSIQVSFVLVKEMMRDTHSFNFLPWDPLKVWLRVRSFYFTFGFRDIFLILGMAARVSSEMSMSRTRLTGSAEIY